jgi:uroporphyrinogen-III synthase
VGSRRERPLQGWRVAITRPAESSAELSDELARLGATPIAVPLIRAVPPEDDSDLRRVAGRLGTYDWIVFTSANAVRALTDAAGRGMAPPARIAAVGPATAAAVEALLGWEVAVLPEEFTGGGLVEAMAAGASLAGVKVLWPRALSSRPELPEGLRKAGAVLDDPVAYRTVPRPAAAVRLGAMVAEGAVDAIIFTSPSAVSAFTAAGVGGSGSAIVAAIGPSTAKMARRHGLEVHVQPQRHTIPALVAAIAEFASDPRGRTEET